MNSCYYNYCHLHLLQEVGGWVVGLVDDGIVVPPHFVVVDSAVTAIAAHDNFVTALAIDNVILVAVAQLLSSPLP